MEEFPLRAVGTEIKVDGLPDAIKVVQVTGKHYRQISHLVLHKSDLEFALGCLAELNNVEKPVVRDALWNSAIVAFIKCFSGNSARIRLNETKIYANEPIGKHVFEYFKNLRNKHVVHDENSYTQCVPCAAINGGNKAYKVEKILAMSAHVETLEQPNYANLHLLVTAALAWVTRQFDELCDAVTTELEAEPYDALISRPAASFKMADVRDIHKRRIE
jgi:hypothetical protein